MLSSFRLFRPVLAAWLILLGAPWPAAQAVVLSWQEQTIANYLASPGQNRPFLQLDDTLTAVARARAADMAARGYFAHVNPDGYGSNALVQQAGYVLPAWWGNSTTANYVESIAAGHAAPGDTWNDWMNSTPHRQHLLAENGFYANQTNFGVGFAVNPASPYVYYWVVITAPPQPIPLLGVVSPIAGGERVLVPSVAVAGTSGGTPPPVSVVYRVENSAGTGNFVTASGVSAWSGTATGLIPGYNNIRMRGLDATGATLVEVNRLVFYVVNKPLTVTVTGGGSVTAGYLGTTDREIGRGYSITATPNATSLFDGWTGGITSTAATLNFAMAEGLQLQANFVPNPFLTRTGGYAGAVGGSRPGGLRLALNGYGGFSGGLRYGEANYGFLGLFNPEGRATVQIPRPGLAPLTLTLQMDVSGSGGVTGTILDGTQTYAVAASADVKVTDGHFPGAGRYTIVIPPTGDLNDPNTPQGNGFATFAVDGYGRAFLAGYLADGSYISTAGIFSAGNVFNFLVPLYGGYGEIAGSFTLRSSDVSDLDGTVHWYRPAYAPALISPGGFDLTGPLVGSRYVRPATGSPALSVGSGTNNAELTLGGGNLDSTVNQLGTLAPNNLVTMSDPIFRSFYAGINPVDGTFGAVFVHPMTGALDYVGGVILQKQNAVYGAFLGKTETGFATFKPAGQ